MALSYPDGWGIYAVHGVRLTNERGAQVTSGKFGVSDIRGEPNAEVRRVMVDLYEGADRGKYLRDAGAAVLHSDVDALGLPRRLLRIEMGDDEPYVAVEVTNSTPEPDGTRKLYTIRVHPELRPMPAPPSRSFGPAQEMTCHNAVASTFGKLGKEYWPEVET
jgi:hypothetical protein